MGVSNQVKVVVLACVIAVLVVGISLGGPKIINAAQMHFGSKGKIELIDRCIEMPGCSIGPADQPFQGVNTLIYMKNLNMSAGQQ